MGKNSTEIIAEQEFSERELDRIIEMAWEDRTPFEAIEFQFGLPEKEVIKIMRGQLKESSFKLWRKRVNSGVSSKHVKKRSQEIKRFKCTRQKAITGNKISKR
ncbi:TIGR03643 family protein [Robertkochia sediminum]|uniref:TIGR03643 family protein n=1 Tax=Robertkochia sediminum TaxID=2785326 RepID=UPI0019328000|nr:TIGR03643 family protein [Robertkochia sediminum]MBL7473268.1 TIGR03643 family protein [Robertkochia sediminum]